MRCELKAEIKFRIIRDNYTRKLADNRDQWMSVRRSYGHPGTGQGLFVSVCHCDYCDQQYRAAASDALVTRNPFSAANQPGILALKTLSLALALHDKVTY